MLSILYLIIERSYLCQDFNKNFVAALTDLSQPSKHGPTPTRHAFCRVPGAINEAAYLFVSHFQPKFDEGPTKNTNSLPSECETINS